MNRNVPRSGTSGSIQGQLLRRSEHRAVAIYLREGSTWIADFVDGQGVLVDVDTWIRFNCGKGANCHVSRRLALEQAIPLSAELIAQIEALHAATDTRRGRTPARMIDAIFTILPRSRLAMLVAGRFRRRSSR